MVDMDTDRVFIRVHFDSLGNKYYTINIDININIMIMIMIVV